MMRRKTIKGFLYFMPTSFFHDQSSVLAFFLFLCHFISLLLFECAGVGDNIRKWVPHSYSHTECYLLLSRNEMVLVYRQKTCQKQTIIIITNSCHWDIYFYPSSYHHKASIQSVFELYLYGGVSPVIQLCFRGSELWGKVGQSNS